jgi:hypothetical protein
MENVTVNKLELASELANMSLLIDYADKMKIYDEKNLTLLLLPGTVRFIWMENELIVRDFERGVSVKLKLSEHEKQQRNIAEVLAAHVSFLKTQAIGKIFSIS